MKLVTTKRSKSSTVTIKFASLFMETYSKYSKLQTASDYILVTQLLFDVDIFKGIKIQPIATVLNNNKQSIVFY